jgi:hypothetical protein
MRFELMVVTVNMTVYCNVMPCSLVDECQDFREKPPAFIFFYDDWGSGLLLHFSVSLPNHADSHKTEECNLKPCNYSLSANSTSFSDILGL